MWWSYIILGLFAGVFSGFFGLGGGTILIPAMMYIFGLTQHQAQGTTLALMVPPIGILAAWRYYQSGNVKINMALFICLGFLIGGLIGAEFVHHVPEQLLKKIFAVFLFVVGVRMFLGK